MADLVSAIEGLAPGAIEAAVAMAVIGVSIAVIALVWRKA